MTSKQWLANPIKHFSEQAPDDSISLDAITTLYQQRQTIEIKVKEINAQTGILSRQIGEAKRNNQATDEILLSMRTLSIEKKEACTQIKKINQEILHYFPKTQTVVKQDNIQKEKSAREYPGNNEDINKITIHILSDHDNTQAWNQYVKTNTAACIHHRAEWQHILKHTYGHDSFYLYACDSQKKIVGVLPLVHIKSRLFSDALVSMPFFQRGGAIADTELIEQKLIQKSVSYAIALNVEHIEYREYFSRTHLAEISASQLHKVNMVLSLPTSKEQLWKNFNSKLRAQIRRPQREDTQTLIGKEELLNNFYAVYSRNMRDLGSPVQSKKFITNILQSFPDNSWLVVIKHKQKPVSACLLLAFGDTMEIPLASTIRDVNHLSMNMLLYWEVLQFAIKNNCQQFDFGRSSKNAGTYNFKKQWGAQAKQLHWHYWLREDKAPPTLNPNNPKYATVINIWKRLPVKLTQWLGPVLVKNIP